MTRVALIGLGMVADMHVAAIRAAGLDLVGVLGRRPEATQAFAIRHTVPVAFSNLVDLVATKPDFAILATPPNARKDIAMTLASARIPVLMEKPIERDSKRAHDIVQIFEDAGVQMGVVMQHRMRPAAQVLKARLTELGEIATIELRVPWWRDQSYYDVPGRGTFERDGGGVLITQAIHQIDLMLHLLGPVSRVSALSERSRLHRLEAEDFAGALLRFGSGAMGTLVASVTHYPGAAEELIVNGAHGSARLSADHLELHLHGQPPERLGSEQGASGSGADPMAFSHALHQAVISDFADALSEGRSPKIPGRSVLAAQALIDAIQLSGRRGAWVDLEAGHV